MCDISIFNELKTSPCAYNCEIALLPPNCDVAWILHLLVSIQTAV